MRGVRGAFTPSVPDAGAAAEIEAASRVFAAAAEVGLPHLVYASIANADRSIPVPHFGWKREIEDRLRAIREDLAGGTHAATARLRR
jgi:uncharacterized protein YbjT (DUF2867 family)